MQITPDENADRPELRLAIKMSREGCRIWTDGSFFGQDKNKAGGAAVVESTTKGTGGVAFIQAFNFTEVGLTDSHYAELWSATLALEQMKNFNVEKIVSDCPFVEKAIRDIKSGRTGHERYEQDIFKRLEQAIANQDDLHVERVRRKEQRIPVANKFARAAAKYKLVHFPNHVENVDAPCLLHRLNERGNITQTTFFDNEPDDSPAVG